MYKRKGWGQSKYLSYFKLCEALSQPGCPICTLVERDSWRYLDALLYERVNDVGTRKELRKSLGFCNWHAWQSLEISNCALGLAIIYEDILGLIIEKLCEAQKHFPIPVASSFWFKVFAKKETENSSEISKSKSAFCPVCRHVQLFEEHYLAILLDHFGEEEFLSAFAASAGICFNHLQEALKKFPDHKNLPLLISRQTEIYEVLRQELAEFIRKQDYQHRHELMGKEIDSWKRVLEMVTGKQNIFAHQMRQRSHKNKK